MVARVAIALAAAPAYMSLTALRTVAGGAGPGNSGTWPPGGFS
jgi:hypothetical protein